jgi:hypothetical protein
MEHLLVWSTVSMAWTEIGLGREEYPPIARELRSTFRDWDEVNDIILGDVLGSFALESLLLPLAAVPVIGMFLITPFPDWGYEEAYLKRRIARWMRVPRWTHYLNPLRLLGYPLAWLMSFSVRYRLKAAFHRAGT